jgi:hypothetical protein
LSDIPDFEKSAGACGITRTVVLSQLDVFNYTCKSDGPFETCRSPCTHRIPVNFVPYFAWAGAEIAVAMVCVGIPTLRPLYLKLRGLADTQRHDTGRTGEDELPRFEIVDPRTVLSTTSSTVSHSRTESNLLKPKPTYVPTHFSNSDETASINSGVIWVKNEVSVREDVANWPLKC